MMKRFLALVLCLCMTLTLLPTTAFAAVSDSLGNTPEENQAILEQLSALTGGSSDQVLSMLDALGLLDEDGNFKVDQTITLDGQVLTLAAVMELLENPATDLTRIADVDGTPVALGDLKAMIQIEQELQRIKDTYFSGREFTGEALEKLNSLMEQLELQGISLQYSAFATKPEGVETVDMSSMMSQTLGTLANNSWSSGTFTVYRGKPVGFSYRIQEGQLSDYITNVEVSIGKTSGVLQSDGSCKLTYDVGETFSLGGCKITVKVTTKGSKGNCDGHVLSAGIGSRRGRDALNGEGVRVQQLGGDVAGLSGGVGILGSAYLISVQIQFEGQPVLLCPSVLRGRLQGDADRTALVNRTALRSLSVAAERQSCSIELVLRQIERGIGLRGYRIIIAIRRRANIGSPTPGRVPGICLEAELFLFHYKKLINGILSCAAIPARQGDSIITLLAIISYQKSFHFFEPMFCCR